jgi:D-alanyl-D-alanine carboxypeptidase (penicillin-binding protein 5/6)
MSLRLRWICGLLGLLAALGLPAQPLPEPPTVAARAYVLLDAASGQELAARQADEPQAPASLTKLMTAYLVFDALRLQRLQLAQALPVSERAQRQPGSRMFLQVGMKVPVQDLLKGLIVQSGNDAAVALAEGVAGSVEQFVQRMNEQAQAWGLRQTRFANPTGLPEPAQQSTARELAQLALRVLQDFPEYTPLFAIRKYHYPGTPAANDGNRNLLLFRDPTVDGLKTGHTDASGYSIIATARREVPLGADGRPTPWRLLAVVLGADSEQARAAETQKLLNWGYTAFEPVRLFEADQAVLTLPVWKGTQATVRLGRPQALMVTVPKGAARQLRLQARRPEPLVAPLARGQAVGTLEVSLGERTLATIPLLALDEVGQAGLLGRAWDAFRLWIQ